MIYAVNLIPAYGRDYARPEDVLTHWLAGKDFLVADVGSNWDGKYTSRHDWDGQAVRIRFRRLAEFVIIGGDIIVGASTDDPFHHSDL
jgi:hypothetical protein